MKLVKVVRKNDKDPNPWLPSELPFVVVSEWEDEGETIYIIRPYGTRTENQNHYIPKSCVAPFNF